VPVIDFVLQRLEARHDLRTAQGKAAAAQEVADVLAGIASPIEQDHYINEAADQLKVDASAVRRLLRGNHRPRAAAAASLPAPSTDTVAANTDDAYLIALLMRLREVPEVPPYDDEIDFVLAENRELYRHIGEAIPAHLEPFAAAAQRYLPRARLHPIERLTAEIREKVFDIREFKLLAERDQIHSLGKEGAIDNRELWQLLDPNSQKMQQVALDRQRERERAGIR